MKHVDGLNTSWPSRPIDVGELVDVEARWSSVSLHLRRGREDRHSEPLLRAVEGLAVLVAERRSCSATGCMYVLMGNGVNWVPSMNVKDGSIVPGTMKVRWGSRVLSCRRV